MTCILSRDIFVKKEVELLKRGYVFLCVLTVFILLLSGCESSEIIFTSTTHKKTNDYPITFQTFTALDQFLEINIKSDIYDEIEGKKLFEICKRDIDKIYKTTKLQNDKQTIYVIEENDYYLTGVFSGKIFCTAESIIDGSYRQNLIKSVCSIQDKWKLVGLEAYIFDTDTYNNSELMNYYSKDVDLDILSFFEAYFIDDFVDENMMLIATDTAKSFSEYIISEYGIEILLSSNCINEKSNYLHFLGLKKEYKDLYYEIFEDYQFQKTEEYPLVVKTAKGDFFYIKPLKDDIETPIQIKEFLFHAQKSVDKLLDYIEKNAPKYYQSILERRNIPCSYYFIEENKDGLNYVDGQNIYLINSFAFVHETVHILIENSVEEERLRCEGIAEYMSNEIYPLMDNNKTKKSLYNFMTANEFDDELTRKSFNSLQQFYLENDVFPSNYLELNYPLLLKSIAYSTLNYPEFKYLLGTGFGKSLGEIVNYNKTDLFLAGNELTYPEAYLMTEYLVLKYGFEKVMNYSIENETFYQNFGIEYEKMKEEFVNEIKSMKVE